MYRFLSAHSSLRDANFLKGAPEISSRLSNFLNMFLGYIQINDQCKQHMLLIIILLQKLLYFFRTKQKLFIMNETEATVTIISEMELHIK
jgi:hypothetical protein